MQDLTKKDDATLAVLKQAVGDYKAHRQLIQFGTFYRLLDPFTQQDGAGCSSTKPGRTRGSCTCRA